MSQPTIVQIVGYKNSGKTHLVCRLIQSLVRLGYRVGTVKHDAHEFEIDQEGRDTWRHRAAGAEVVAITSPSQTAIVEQRPQTLSELVSRISGVDILLVEGFKMEDYPKIVLLRQPEDYVLTNQVSRVAAMAVSFPWQQQEALPFPVFDRDDTEGLLHIVLQIIKGE